MAVPRTVVVPHKWPIFGSKLTLLTFPMIIPTPDPYNQNNPLREHFVEYFFVPLDLSVTFRFSTLSFFGVFFATTASHAGHIEYHHPRRVDMESANSNCVAAENPGPWNLNLKRSVSKYFDHVPSAFCRRPRPLPTSWLEKDVSDLWSHRRNTSSVLGTRLSNPWFSNIRTGRNFQDRRAEKRTNH